MSGEVCRLGDAGYIEPGSDKYYEVVGCSEVADILGHGYKSALDLWKIKTHRASKPEHKRIFDRGHLMEQMMSRMVRSEYGRNLVAEQVQYRPEAYPYLVYHADGMFPKWSPLNDGAREQEGPGIWEAKAPGSHMANKMNNEGMTENYICQGQMGMFVASQALHREISWGTYGFLDYDAWELVCFDTMADPQFQARAIQMVSRFYDCMVRDVPPDDVAAEPIVVPVLRPKAEIVDPMVVGAARRLAELSEEIRPLKDEDAGLRDFLKMAMQEYAEAEIPGVMKFSYKYQKEGEKIDGEGLLEYCQTLCDRASIPFRRSDWVTPKPPVRVFKPTPIKQKG